MTDISKTISTTISKTISTTISDTVSEMRHKYAAHGAIAEHTAMVTYTDMVEYVSVIANAVNRAYCTAIGDAIPDKFDDLDIALRNSLIAGVNFHIANPGVDPRASHESWLSVKSAEGWAYGAVKDIEAKLHPCFVAYDDLPIAQRVKDYLFTAIVNVHRDALNALKEAEAVENTDATV